MTIPSQFPQWLQVAERDGLGGASAEPPAIIRGQVRRMVYSLPDDPDFGNWTGGTFAAVLRASPGAADPVLGTFTVSVGAKVGGLTPVTFTLSAATSAALPAPPVDTGLTELFLAITFTPSGGTPESLLATRQLVRARV